MVGNVAGPDAASMRPEHKFSNIQPDVYWYGTGFAPNSIFVWGIDFIDGMQYDAFGTFGKGSEFFAWALRDSDVGPEPASITLAWWAGWAHAARLPPA